VRPFNAGRRTDLQAEDHVTDSKAHGLSGLREVSIERRIDLSLITPQAGAAPCPAGHAAQKNGVHGRLGLTRASFRTLLWPPDGTGMACSAVCFSADFSGLTIP